MNAALFVFSSFHRSVTGFKNSLYERGWIRPRRAPLPVVSVGSLALGGMGKTPLVMEILSHMISRGLRPALVTRGYRGAWEKRGGMLSDGRRVYGDWRQAGDEACLVARRFPQAGVFVGKHRFLSCLRAKAEGFDLAVLDDGFQHRKLHRDLDIVIFDPSEKTALREPMSALKRAHLILLPESAGKKILEKVSKRSPAAEVVRYSVSPRTFHRVSETGSPEALDLARFRGARALAFCGIARPERFFTTLEGLGLLLLDRMAFPDHHSYPPSSWRRIGKRVEALKPEAIVTTEKDAVKLGPATSLPLHALRIGLALPSEFFRAVDSALAPKESG
ncbi:MAG TPA: tetraacyldisaccharide 4'-kinase [Acidobacteriota bacterium]